MCILSFIKSNVSYYVVLCKYILVNILINYIYIILSIKGYMSVYVLPMALLSSCIIQKLFFVVVLFKLILVSCIDNLYQLQHTLMLLFFKKTIMIIYMRISVLFTIWKL